MGINEGLCVQLSIIESAGREPKNKMSVWLESVWLESVWLESVWNLKLSETLALQECLKSYISISLENHICRILLLHH